MIKRFITLILLVFLASFACAEENHEIIWKLGRYVDDFNDPTGEYFIIGGPYNGEFSNIATNDSELMAYIIVDSEKCLIRLLEYNTNKLFSLSGKDYKLKIKATIRSEDQEALSYYTDSSNSIIFYMTGTLLDNGDIFIDNCFYDENYSNKVAGKELQGIMFSSLSDVLLHSSDVKFSIKKTDDPDKYYFTADRLYQYYACDVLLGVAREKGYEEAIASYGNELLYQQAYRASIEKDRARAIEIYTKLGNYKDSADRLAGLLSTEPLNTDNITVGTIITHIKYGKGIVTNINDEYKDVWGLVYDIKFDSGEEESFLIDKAIESGQILSIENP